MAALIGLQAFLAINVCNANVDSESKRALELYQSNDRNGAIAAYQDLIKNNPNDPQVPNWFYMVSSCAWFNKDYPACFATLEKAVELTKDDNEKRYWRVEFASKCYLVGEYATAISDLEKLISENPKNTNVADWYLQESLCYRLSGQNDKSYEALNKAMELAKGPQQKCNIRAHYSLQYAMDGNYSKAAPMYKGLIKEYPNSPDIPEWNRELSLCCWMQKDYSACFSALHETITRTTDAEKKRSLAKSCGIRAYQVRSYNTAASTLIEGTKGSPNTNLTRLIARSYANSHNFDKAIATYKTLRKTSPQSDREWQLWMGYCYEQKGDYKKAESAFRELIRKYPKDNSVSSAYYCLARCLVRQNKAAQAQALLDTYYRDGNHKPEAMFWKAAVLAIDMREYNKALPVLKKYLSAYPDHNLAGEARWIMISSLLHTNQWKQAEKIAVASLKQERTDIQKISIAQDNEDLGLFPTTDNNAASKFASNDELTHSPRESQAQTRYAVGYLCRKNGNHDLSGRLMNNIIDQYPDCAIANKAKDTLNLWNTTETARQ